MILLNIARIGIVERSNKAIEVRARWSATIARSFDYSIEADSNTGRIVIFFSIQLLKKTY